MKLYRYSCMWILVLVIASCASASYQTQSLEASGFSTDVRLYAKPEASSKRFDIVFLHDNRGNPNRWHNSQFAKQVNTLGYQFIAPHMPWSEKHGYHGTRSLALELIDATVNLNNNRDVVLIGHDLGAIMAMQYVSANPSAKVKAIVLVEPAHDPNMDRLLFETTASDAKKACIMVSNGKNIDKAVFSDLNLGKASFIEATAEYYCSFFNVTQFPDTMQLVADIKLPTLVISSTNDSSPAESSHKALFDVLPANAKNKYMKLSGTHNNVLNKHVEEISAWIDSL